MVSSEKPNHHPTSWELFPETHQYLQNQINTFLEHNRLANNIAVRITHETSTRFIDWVDHLILPKTSVSEEQLHSYGYTHDTDTLAPPLMKIYRHAASILFPILLSDSQEIECVIKPENISDFIQILGKDIPIDGPLYAPIRKAQIHAQDQYIFSAIERRGENGFMISNHTDDLAVYQWAYEAFLTRNRHFSSKSEGLLATRKLIELWLDKLNAARVADAFFRAERKYWEHRNWAGQIQNARQNRLGLGWGNHDHHTYRSSRVHFRSLLEFFTLLGFQQREPFYTGNEAGWGAQILEHPICSIVIFADVDLDPSEDGINFLEKSLAPQSKHGTIGLWVELHGESILTAGLHHLAVRLSFELATVELENLGIKSRPPFSSFPYLKQAFTVGEIFHLRQNHITSLLKNEVISEKESKLFIQNGAIGTHLENIERNQGYKGFNPQSVSTIITATDPRSIKFQKHQ